MSVIMHILFAACHEENGHGREQSGRSKGHPGSEEPASFPDSAVVLFEIISGAATIFI